jgi:membrane-bound lytic murein transglycosylase D
VPSRLPVETPPAIAAPPPEVKKPDIVISPVEVDYQVSRNKETDVEPAARDIFETLPGEDGKTKIPVPEGLGTRVDKWMRYFQSSGRDRFGTYLSRSTKYSKLMQDILNKYGLPGDLIYLALIESGFSPKAYSVAAAAGPWQFIAETGKRYGLKIDWWADERRDYEKSTHAAASYLRDLYGMFDSWQLATAAYNAGEGKISRAVGRYKSNEYATLIKYGYLAQETKDYVPKMIAAQTIAKAPDKYGFGSVEYQSPLEFDKVEVPGGIDLSVVGEIIGVPYESLREWNPELRRFCTPPTVQSYELRVPRSYGRVVQEHLDEIRDEAKVTFILHTASKGESLESLAEKYETTAATIRELNGLSGNALKKSAKLVIPVTGLGSEDAVPGHELSADQLQMAQMRDEGRRGKRGRRHAAAGKGGSSVKVRKGDTLAKIAKRSGVSVSSLAAANGLSAGARVKSGTRLKIPGRGADDDGGLTIVAKDAGGKAGSKKDKATAGTAPEGGGKDTTSEAKDGQPARRKSQRHVVQKGETLEAIARQHGVTVEEVSRRNKLKDGQKIRRGRVLVIPSEG